MKNTVLQTVYGRLVGFELRRLTKEERKARGFHKRQAYLLITDDGQEMPATRFEAAMWKLLPWEMREMVG